MKLADLLEADAKNKKGVKFDLGIWASPAGDEWKRSWNTKEAAVKVDCSTAACAVGLACVSGAFARGGLTYGYKESWGGGFYLVPKFGRSREFNAVTRFFGIKKPDALFLFSAEKYPDDKITGAVAERFVAKRIRDFVAGKVSA